MNLIRNFRSVLYVQKLKLHLNLDKLLINHRRRPVFASAQADLCRIAD